MFKTTYFAFFSVSEIAIAEANIKDQWETSKTVSTLRKVRVNIIADITKNRVWLKNICPSCSRGQTRLSNYCHNNRNILTEYNFSFSLSRLLARNTWNARKKQRR